MTSPIGYGTLKVNDALWPHLDRLKPACMLFIDDAGAAARFANAFPDSVSIFRGFRKDESDMYKQPGQMLKYVQGIAGSVPKNVWINVLCEPALGGDYVANLKALVAESIECLKWAYANGRRLALPHGALYGLNPEHYPYLLPLINKINERPDLAILSSDEYFGGHAFSGMHDTRGGEAWHVDPAHWLDANWPTLPKHYHCGRITDLFEWCVAQGVRPPRWLATESGADDLSDIGTWLKTLKISAGYPNVRGWKSLADQWLDWYKSRGWSAQRAYVEMLTKLWQQVYSKWKNVVGLCLFTWGYQQDRIWEQFDLSEAGEFQTLLEKAEWESVTVAPTPVGKPGNAGTPTNVGQLITPDVINIRNAPTTAATIVKAAKSGAYIQRYAGGEKKGVVEKDGSVHDWSWVELLDNLTSAKVTASGWQARVVASWELQIIAPVPAPVKPVFLPPTVHIDTRFNSQYKMDSKNGCGPADVAMEVRYVDSINGKNKYPNLTATQVSVAMHRGDSLDADIAMMLATAASPYGVDLNFQANVTPEMLRAEIEARRPPTIVFRRDKISGELAIYNFAGSHYGMLVGYGKTEDGQNYFELREPLQGGGLDDPIALAEEPAPLPVIESELVEALKNEGTGNNPNQALFLDPSMIPVEDGIIRISVGVADELLARAQTDYDLALAFKAQADALIRAAAASLDYAQMIRRSFSDA